MNKAKRTLDGVGRCLVEKPSRRVEIIGPSLFGLIHDFCASWVNLLRCWGFCSLGRVFFWECHCDGFRFFVIVALSGWRVFTSLGFDVDGWK